MKDFFTFSTDVSITVLESDQTQGLTTETATHRLTEYGKNRFPSSSRARSRSRIFLDQWKSPLIIILVVAGTVSGLLHEYIDMSIIYGTALINAFIGFLQEYKANQALEKMQSLVSYTALVLRDGVKQEVNTDELVPGDIVYLSAGNNVPADGRLLRVTGLEIEEAALTGESEPIKKHIDIIAADANLGDQYNMAFRGTKIVNGEGIMIVTATGVSTQLGNIARLVKETEEDLTPLQRQLEKLGKQLSIIVILIAMGIFAIGMFFGEDRYSMFELFETAIAVAVAAIPEGLVISLTVILAIGMQFILKRRALVRKLVAAETLGSVSVICSDKTGTLTEGKMRLKKMLSFHDATPLEDIPFDQDTKKAIEIGLLCNNAVHKNPSAPQSDWEFYGSSTESALLYAGAQLRIDRSALENSFPRLAELPFSSANKFMATLHPAGQGFELFVKGAPDILIHRATRYLDNGAVQELTEEKKQAFIENAQMLAGQGFRTLTFAYRPIAEKKEVLQETDIQELILVSIAALADPLRADVKDTIQLAQAAGIRVVMITGDHARTAEAIAQELGLPVSDEHIIEGKELEDMSDNELQEAVKNASVFARVAPEHKIRIVRAFQANGEVVAMTGDGVNDAPALKGADIGVAVGSGTDVARETADMVLLDDGFPTIVAAVEEGRGIYQNIRKVVVYLLAGSFAEVLMITGSIVAGLPIAALPAQILWVNIIEDAFPTMALAFDKGDKENMKDKPRKKGTPIIDAEMRSMIILKSIVANILLFSIFVYFYTSTGDIKLTRTIVFVGFAIDALFYIFSIRSMRKMIWHINPFNNMYLLGAVAFGWIMLILAIYLKPFQFILQTVPLELWHWALMIGFGLCNVLIIEMVKYFFVHRGKKVVVA